MERTAGSAQNDRRTTTRATPARAGIRSAAAPSGSAARLGRAWSATATTISVAVGRISSGLHAAGREQLSSVRPAAR